MPAERAGYTVTMFLVDIAPSMGKLRTVNVAPGPNGEKRTREITNLEWALKYVMMKVQEMIFNGRKTDQCGVILFGGEKTKNIVNEENGGYENVYEYIPIDTPNSSTLSKIAQISPSSVVGDPIDALIVGIQTQAAKLASKSTWTRRIVLVTDGEYPFDASDWEKTIEKLNELNVITTIVGVDFDDPEIYTEPNKSNTKRRNEAFYETFAQSLHHGLVGTCVFALRECSRPEPKVVKSTMVNNFLRLGDVSARPEDSVEIQVKTCKATLLVRPPPLKKFAKRDIATDAMDWTSDDIQLPPEIFAPLERYTEYIVEPHQEEAEKEKGKDKGGDLGDMDIDVDDGIAPQGAKVDKENLVRAYKYGATWVPSETEHDKLPTKGGIEITGFIPDDKWNRDFALGDVQYIFADPSSARSQVAFSSIVQAMHRLNAVALVRFVIRDGSAPKMGICAPRSTDKKDYLVYVSMPFSEDYRKVNFPSLEKLKNKKGELLTDHPYLPTKEMLDTMGDYVDKMDLMHEGEPQDDDGTTLPWYNLLDSYNPAVHRVKQAIFHAAIVTDLARDPVPPPHPEVTKYFDPPTSVLERSNSTLETCKKVFNVKAVQTTSARRKKTEQDATENTGDDFSLADLMGGPSASTSEMTTALKQEPSRNGLPMSSQATLVASGQPEPRGKSSELSSVKEDRGIAPGRIIGNVSPLDDFKMNIRGRGDVVSKAVQDMCAVIVEIVESSFSTQRYQEALDCMGELRKVSLEEDEVYTWNEFLRDFKKMCLSSKFKNGDFWTHVKKIGRPLSLISEREAEAAGGVSEYSEHAAARFLKD